MKRTTTARIAATGSLVIAALLIPAPAFAVPFTDANVEVGEYSWLIDENPQAVVGGSNLFYDQAFGGSQFQFAGVDTTAGGVMAMCLGADQAAPDANGDVVISCDPYVSALGHTFESEMRLYSGGDLARHLITISNPTTAPLGLQWVYMFQFGTNRATAVSSAPTLGANVVSAADTWIYNDSRFGLNAAIAWGLPSAKIIPSSVGASTDSAFEVTKVGPTPADITMIAPSKSVTLAFYFKLDGTGTTVADDAVDVAAVTSEFASFSGRLTRGLPAGTVVSNWGTVAGASTTDSAAELAETGPAETTVMFGLGAAALLALGAAIMIARRQRRGTRAAV